MSLLAYVLALVIFVLAGLGVEIGEEGRGDLIAWGLAAFALGHVLPNGSLLARVRRAPE